ncbi:MAG: DUF1800 domain-containing protein [Terriglobales bacterium]
MCTTKRVLALLLALMLGLPSPWLVAGDKSAPTYERKRALHALNRLTFGPRPGEVEQVAALGVEKWIEKQLRPESISDKALEARLAPFRTLKMDSREMVENFPPPPLLRAVAQGRAPMPSDPEKRAVYEAGLERYRDRQQRQQKGDRQNGQGATANENEMSAPREDESDPQMDPEARARRREARMYADLKAEELLAMTPEQRLQALMKMSNDERRALARALGPEERERLFSEFTPEQRETVMALVNPQMVVTTELQQAKILRAVYSERQLEEVMTDFWFNHFNVFINKGADRYLITAYERDVIRPHALGKFEELLASTAESPAMLFYLDNWQSVGPKSQFAQRSPAAPGRAQRRRGGLLGSLGRNRFPGEGESRPRGDNGNDEQMQRRQQQQQQRRGLNENYARELMELHTLGVNGGYTQKDVTEVARVFTGWTIRQPRLGGGFDYNGRMHEPGDKTVLGQKISESGKKEGEQVLKMLARHPSTAKFISTKLAQRFVSDAAPAALVERMAASFQRSGGDIKEVLRTLFRSPEFWSSEAYRAKVKTPLEFVASAVRATGADVSNGMALVGALNKLGMPLYAAQPPTGYSMKAEAWVNSAALLNRMNFALGLGTGRLPGIKLDAQHLLGSSVPGNTEIALTALEQSLLAGDVSRQTHDTIRKQLGNPKVNLVQGMDAGNSPASPSGPGVMIGLLLGSPEFQRR